MAFARILKSWFPFWRARRPAPPACGSQPYPQAATPPAHQPVAQPLGSGRNGVQPRPTVCPPLPQPGALSAPAAVQAAEGPVPCMPCEPCSTKRVAGAAGAGPALAPIGAPAAPACAVPRAGARRLPRTSGAPRAMPMPGGAEPALALVQGGADTGTAWPLKIRYARGARSASRLVISGRLADVCAELDRLALLEQRGELRLLAA